MATSFTRDRAPAPRLWPGWPFHTLLWVLLLGPISSPLLRATGLPLAAEAGALARDLLASYVCPTPERSIMLLGLPMAVCARCWGATLGLGAARLLVARGAKGRWPRWLMATLSALRGLPWPARLSLAALPFLLWPLEIAGQGGGWWFVPLWLLLLNGAQAGLAAGLLFCSLWPGIWPDRPVVAGHAGAGMAGKKLFQSGAAPLGRRGGGERIG